METLLGDITILMIDDDRYMRNIVKSMLSAFPTVSFLEAANAPAGWDLYCHAAPDIILVDWEMPKINGLQFIRRVRQAAGSPRPATPIILMTGHANPNLIAKARDAGTHQILGKPVSAEALFSTITATLNKDVPFIRSKTYIGPDRRRPMRRPPYNGPDRRKTSS
ncbi:MAG: response regulator [Alphaproteobacteria bacterium]